MRNMREHADCEEKKRLERDQNGFLNGNDDNPIPGAPGTWF